MLSSSKKSQNLPLPSPACPWGHDARIRTRRAPKDGPRRAHPRHIILCLAGDERRRCRAPSRPASSSPSACRPPRPGAPSYLPRDWTGAASGAQMLHVGPLPGCRRLCRHRCTSESGWVTLDSGGVTSDSGWAASGRRHVPASDGTRKVHPEGAPRGVFSVAATGRPTERRGRGG